MQSGHSRHLAGGGSADDADNIPPMTPVFSFAFLSRSISVGGIFSQIWKRWYVLAACVLAFFLIGIYEAHRIGPRFVASLDIQPAQADVGAGSSGMGAGTVGGLLGSMGGDAASSIPIPEFIQFQAALSSQGVAREMDKRYNMVCRVFEGRCDLKTHQWKPSTGFRAAFAGFLAALQGLPDPNGPATAADLAAYTLGAVGITKEKTGVVTLTYENPDPKFATMFLTRLWETSNNYLKGQDREIRQDYIAYLSQRITTTTSLAQREAIQTLLEEQERHLMRTAADVPYAAAVLDGPRVMPVNRVLKTIVLYVFVGIVLGGAAAYFTDMLVAMFIAALRRSGR